MGKMSKIRELAVIVCVMALMHGIVSYASSTVALYADQKSASSASLPVTDGYFTVWGSVSSASKYQVEFVVPDGWSRDTFSKSCAPGASFPTTDCFVFRVTSTNLNLYGNSREDQKKECIASGGIAD